MRRHDTRDPRLHRSREGRQLHLANPHKIVIECLGFRKAVREIAPGKLQEDYTFTMVRIARAPKRPPPKSPKTPK